MRTLAVVLALGSLGSLGSLAAIGGLSLSCESTSSPSAPDASSAFVPTEDGATCACATPDCLPNCSALPTCKLVCVVGSTGAVLDWIDSCGTVQYTQACPTGCADAGPDACQ
jgi:hypothetical protein